MLQHGQTLQSWLRSDLVTNESVHIECGFWIQGALQMQMFWLPQLLLSVLHRGHRRFSLADETGLEGDVFRAPTSNTLQLLMGPHSREELSQRNRPKHLQWRCQVFSTVLVPPSVS